MANFSFNKVILGGRLTADPELKTTPSGVSVTSFTVAVNRRFGGKEGEQPQADFINVTAWRATAEFICKYFRKASSICIMGSIQTRSWEKDGQKHYATEIVADEAYFVDAKGESSAPAQTVYSSPAAVLPQIPDAPVVQPAPVMEELKDDDELPF